MGVSIFQIRLKFKKKSDISKFGHCTEIFLFLIMTPPLIAPSLKSYLKDFLNYYLRYFLRYFLKYSKKCPLKFSFSYRGGGLRGPPPSGIGDCSKTHLYIDLKVLEFSYMSKNQNFEEEKNRFFYPTPPQRGVLKKIKIMKIGRRA